jgi:hypothetical protein
MFSERLLQRLRVVQTETGVQVNRPIDSDGDGIKVTFVIWKISH